MRQLKNPWVLFGKIALFLGGAFLLPALILLIVYLAANSVFVLRILGSVLGINGAVWLVLGWCFTCYGKSVMRKLERLKGEGCRYEGEIVRILPNDSVRIYGNLSVNIECVYRNQEGKTCLVKSSTLMLNRLYNTEDLRVYVYAGRHDPKDYAVEVIMDRDKSGQFDYDYR